MILSKLKAIFVPDAAPKRGPRSSLYLNKEGHGEARENSAGKREVGSVVAGNGRGKHHVYGRSRASAERESAAGGLPYAAEHHSFGKAHGRAVAANQEIGSAKRSQGPCVRRLGHF